MDRFWEQTWKLADNERIAQYLAHFDLAEDAIIRQLEGRHAKTVCDAGCGCGAYSLKLARFGFSVSGFDVSEDAVALTKRLLTEYGYPAQHFHTSDILATDYADGQFDAVVALDVLDHMPIREGIAALKELLRIVEPGGCVLLTLDKTDDEYESETHDTNSDGDYLYTSGKWSGMAFHPYTEDEIVRLTKGFSARIIETTDAGFTVAVEKNHVSAQQQVAC